jgi:hypothetical protein
MTAFPSHVPTAWALLPRPRVAVTLRCDGCPAALLGSTAEDDTDDAAALAALALAEREALDAGWQILRGHPATTTSPGRPALPARADSHRCPECRRKP